MPYTAAKTRYENMKYQKCGESGILFIYDTHPLCHLTADYIRQCNRRCVGVYSGFTGDTHCNTGNAVGTK